MNPQKIDKNTCWMMYLIARDERNELVVNNAQLAQALAEAQAKIKELEPEEEETTDG